MTVSGVQDAAPLNVRGQASVGIGPAVAAASFTIASTTQGSAFAGVSGVGATFDKGAGFQQLSSQLQNVLLAAQSLETTVDPSSNTATTMSDAGQILTVSSTSSVMLTGLNSSDAVAGGDNALVAGQGSTVTISGQNDVGVIGLQSNLVVSGQNNVVALGLSSTLTVSGDNNTIDMGSGTATISGQNNLLKASGCTITLAPGVTATIIGNNDTIIGAAEANLTLIVPGDVYYTDESGATVGIGNSALCPTEIITTRGAQENNAQWASSDSSDASGLVDPLLNSDEIKVTAPAEWAAGSGSENQIPVATTAQSVSSESATTPQTSDGAGAPVDIAAYMTPANAVGTLEAVGMDADVLKVFDKALDLYQIVENRPDILQLLAGMS
jgi:hypothetical protein